MRRIGYIEKQFQAVDIEPKERFKIVPAFQSSPRKTHPLLGSAWKKPFSSVRFPRSWKSFPADRAFLWARVLRPSMAGDGSRTTAADYCRSFSTPEWFQTKGDGFEMGKAGWSGGRRVDVDWMSNLFKIPIIRKFRWFFQKKLMELNSYEEYMLKSNSFSYLYVIRIPMVFYVLLLTSDCYTFGSLKPKGEELGCFSNCNKPLYRYSILFEHLQ